MLALDGEGIQSMGALRRIFFGLVAVVELPVNAIIELWRQPGRGRGLLLGFPAIFVLIITLLTVGWAKYGSNAELIKDYWQATMLDRQKVDELTERLTAATGTSRLGDPAETKTSGDPENQEPEAPANEGLAAQIVRQVQRELYIPPLDDESSDPQVVVRASFAEGGKVKDVEVLEASEWPRWDDAVVATLKVTDALELLPDNLTIPPNTDMVFGYRESEREKLRFRMSIALKKLIDLDPSNAKYKYEYGILSSEMGYMSNAHLMMDQIASLEKPGLAAAHLWQARHIWSDKTSFEPMNSRRQRCRQHLELALQADPDNLEANEGLGELYYSMGNFIEAEKYYRKVWEHRLSTTLRLVSIYSQQKDTVKLDELLNKSKSRLEEALNAEPGNMVFIFDIERIYLLQGRIQEAIDFLKSQITDDNREEIHDRLARIYAGWAKGDAAQAQGIFSRDAFEKTKLAYQYDPDTPDVLWMLTVIGIQGADFAGEAQAIYDPVANRDTAPGEVLREYSSYLIEQGKTDEAIRWLEDAHQRSPLDAIVANNLAYLLLTGPNTDAPRALELASQAIQNAPISARPSMRASLFDTKAAALVSLNRHAEAIPFLEIALRDRGNDRRIIGVLRDCYATTGQQQMADSYQRMLDELGPESEAPK
jgi:tetratricopeptide (TPR) repeat protein